MESDHSLEPHLKAGSHSVTETIPRVFDTKVGRRHVPKWRSPPTPPLEMVESARRGVLKGFFRSGRIQGASPEYVGMANPKTAILTLDDIYEFETRPLESLDQKVAEDARTLQNLFYIALHDAELPSYHFWTEPGDVDPVEAGKETDWGAHFENHPPSPVTTAIIAKLEDERKSRIQHREAGNKVDDSSEGPTNSVVAQAGPQGQQYQSVASGLLHDHLDALQVKEDPLAFLDDYDDVGSAQSVRSRKCPQRNHFVQTLF